MIDGIVPKPNACPDCGGKWDDRFGCQDCGLSMEDVAAAADFYDRKVGGKNVKKEEE